MILPSPTMSLEEASGLRLLDPARLRLWWEGASLRLELRDDSCHDRVSVLRAFPISKPHSHYILRDERGREIGVIVDPRRLDRASGEAISAELERTYFTTTIERILSVTEQFGTIVWDVVTSRGPRQFTSRDGRDHVMQPSPERILLNDIDGNRFEVTDIGRLDHHSRILLRNYL